MSKFFFVCVLTKLFLVQPSSGNNAVEGLFNRVQKTWIERWTQIRDQGIKPRLFAEMKLREKPTFVETIQGKSGCVDLAVCYWNEVERTVTLRRFPNISNWLSDGGDMNATELEIVGERIGWPNAVGKVEEEYMSNSGTTYWWSASSYHHQENTEGGIVFLPVGDEDKDPIQITPADDYSTQNEEFYYYSMIDWVDMNQDGWPDIITSRSRGERPSIQYTELMWLQNPGYMANFGVHRWQAHRITNGPDVNFRVMRIPLPSGESRLVIIGAGYWDNKLYAVWTEDPEENWTNVDAINERVIDNNGWFFDLQIADVNADGRDDVMVTTWTYGTQQGTVMVYEIPCDFIRDKWSRHVLIESLVDMQVPDMMSGGKINVFHPIVRDSRKISQKKKPYILVSGDNEGKLSVLIPSSKKTNNWDYTSHTIYRTRSSIGAIAIEDFNNDGFMEIVVPVLDHRKLLFFTYKPGEIDESYFRGYDGIDRFN